MSVGELPVIGELWHPEAAGVITFPSGRRVRGRGLRQPPPPGPEPHLGVYLLSRPPELPGWSSRWIAWRDFRVPTRPADALSVLAEAWEAAADTRVEVACGGGVGRTGTALAVLAVFDRVPPAHAVDYVRAHYHPRAVETPWQRGFVERVWRPGSPDDTSSS